MHIYKIFTENVNIYNFIVILVLLSCLFFLIYKYLNKIDPKKKKNNVNEKINYIQNLVEKYYSENQEGDEKSEKKEKSNFNSNLDKFFDCKISQNENYIDVDNFIKTTKKNKKIKDSMKLILPRTPFYKKTKIM